MTAVSWNLVLPPWDRADFPSLAIVPTATQSHMDPEASLSCHVHLQSCFLNFTFTPERFFSGNRILGWSLPQNIVPLSSDLHDLWRESSPSNCFVLIINALFFYGSFITFFRSTIFSHLILMCLEWAYLGLSSLGRLSFSTGMFVVSFTKFGESLLLEKLFSVLNFLLFS